MIQHNDKIKELLAEVLVKHLDPLVAAIRANYCWVQAEHNGLGSFDQRSALCAHSEYLTYKAWAVINGRPFEEAYKGSKHMLVWPNVELHETTQEEGEELCVLVLETDAAKIT